MQVRMELLDNYMELSQSKDCIRLLREIKASVFEFETQAYIYDSMLKASSAIYNIKQGERESVNEYRKRFREQFEMLEHYRGSFGKDEGLVLEEYRRAGIETKSDTIDCNSGIHKQMEEKAKQRTERMVVLKNADTRRFGVLLVDLENNFSWRVDQYPKDMTEEYNLLVKHKSPPDNNNKSRRNRIRERRRPDNQEGKNILAQDTVEFHYGITCYNCGEEGHYVGDCPHLDKRKGKGNVYVHLVNREKESDEEDGGMEIGFLNTAIQFESDNSVSTSSS